jgi:hypothetical protein
MLMKNRKNRTTLMHAFCCFFHWPQSTGFCEKSDYFLILKIYSIKPCMDQLGALRKQAYNL